MKKVRFLLVMGLLSFAAVGARAEIVDQFFLKSFASLEYQAPRVTSGGTSSNFRTKTFDKQLTRFENIAVGVHFRIHKYVGLNANWLQTGLRDGTLKAYVDNKASFKMNQFQFSSLFYLPLTANNSCELFAELGVADVHSDLSFANASAASGAKTSDRKIHAMYGIGLQVAPFESSDDAFRVTYLRYAGNLGLIGTDYSAVKFGFIKSF